MDDMMHEQVCFIHGDAWTLRVEYLTLPLHSPQHPSQLALAPQIIQPMEPLLHHPLLLVLDQHLARMAHDQQTGRSTPLLFNGRTNMLQTRAEDPLIRAARALDHCDGQVRGVALGEQTVDEGRKAVQRHEEHEGARSKEFGGFKGRAFAAGAGADEHLVGDTAVRRGDGSEERGAECACDAREDTGSVSVGAKEVVLLATATVDVRVALLDPNHDFASLEACQTELEELFLGFVSVSREFSRNMDGGAAGNEVENFRGNKLVGEDEVGGENGFVSCTGEEIRIAGAGASEDNTACSCAGYYCCRSHLRGAAAGEFAE